MEKYVYINHIFDKDVKLLVECLVNSYSISEFTCIISPVSSFMVTLLICSFPIVLTDKMSLNSNALFFNQYFVFFVFFSWYFIICLKLHKYLYNPSKVIYTFLFSHNIAMNMRDIKRTNYIYKLYKKHNNEEYKCISCFIIFVLNSIKIDVIFCLSKITKMNNDCRFFFIIYIINMLFVACYNYYTFDVEEILFFVVFYLFLNIFNITILLFSIYVNRI